MKLQASTATPSYGRGYAKSPLQRLLERALELEAGDGLLSHALAGIVPSALTGLTAVFGMGTGVAPSR
jgi:hypothetical protein